MEHQSGVIDSLKEQLGQVGETSSQENQDQVSREREVSSPLSPVFLPSVYTLLYQSSNLLFHEYSPLVKISASYSLLNGCANTRGFRKIQTELLNTIRRQEREISLVSTAWYNVQSRLPNSNVTVSRYRHPASTSAGGGAETKQSWLAKQRGIVAGGK